MYSTQEQYVYKLWSELTFETIKWKLKTKRGHWTVVSRWEICRLSLSVYCRRLARWKFWRFSADKLIQLYPLLIRNFVKRMSSLSRHPFAYVNLKSSDASFEIYTLNKRRCCLFKQKNAMKICREVNVSQHFVCYNISYKLEPVFYSFDREKNEQRNRLRKKKIAMNNIHSTL